MGLSAVYFGVYVCGMTDVNVKLYSKGNPKCSICFQTHLCERCTKVTLSPQTEAGSSSSCNKIENSNEEKS